MSKELTTSSDVKTAQELVDEICRPSVLPDESQEAYETLKGALLGELLPQSAYSQLLANQLVDLEWELQRHRRMRNSLLKNEYRAQAYNVFLGTRDPVQIAVLDKEAKQLASDLVHENPERKNNALQELEKRGVSPHEIMAIAHVEVTKYVRVHERQIAEIEIRRRKLREDYERHNAGYGDLAEDAIVIM